MATIFANDFNKKNTAGGQRPAGWVETYPVVPAVAVAATEKIYFGIIPAGVEITDVSLIHDADIDATLSLGFEPVDALPVAVATQWFSAQALSIAGRKESASQPISFEYPVKLVGLVAGLTGLAIGTKVTPVLKGKGNGVA